MRETDIADNRCERPFALGLGILLSISVCAVAGQPQETSRAPQSATQEAPKEATPVSTAALRLTLQDALDRARKNSTQFQGALLDAGIAREDRSQARAALLPSVNFDAQALYTQGNGLGGVRFIANNAVHEYVSEGHAHEAIDLASFSNFRRLSALTAAVRARAEIASRGLVVTVVQNYFAVAAAQQKMEIAQRTADEGERFFKLTQDLERGGEVAHSDVIKAELQMQERRRQLQEAQLAGVNARLSLAVLIFPDSNDNFEVSDDLHSNVMLPPLAAVQQQAAQDNPEVRAALAAVEAAGHDAFGARAGYFPSLSLDYFYGIDAAHFATYTPTPDGRIHNLGYSVLASVTIR